MNPKDAEERRTAAVDEFGYTPHLYDAGYILPSGKMLNLSGEKGLDAFGQQRRGARRVSDNTS